MDPVLLPYLLHALAGAAGGGIRWWSAGSSPAKGLGHVFAGAMAGTFFGGFVFAALKPVADMSGMTPADGELLGAHIAGVLGMNLYAVVPDLVTAWLRSKASTQPQEPGQ